MSKFSDKSASELETLLEEKRQSLREYRFDITGGSDEDVRDMRRAKKDVARILTELRTRRDA